MNDELGILISGKLDIDKTVNQINSDLQALTKQIKSLSLNIDTSKMTKDIEKQLEKIQKTTGQSIKIDLGDISNEGGEIANSLKLLEKQYRGMTESVVKNTRIVENEFGELEEQVRSYLVTLKTADNEIKKIRISPTLDENDNEVLRQTEIQTINKANQEREKALRYEQQVRKQIEQNTQKEKERTEQLEHQVKLAQREAQIRVNDLRRRYEPVLTQEQNRQLDQYVASMNALSATTPKVQNRIRELNTDFKEISASVREAGSRTDSFGKQLSVALQRIPIWMIGMTAFYQPLRRLQDAIRQIIELDSQMVVLERVSNGMIDINQALEESIEIAGRLGNTVNQVNEAFIEFSRQGFRGEDLSAISEVATIMGNVSDLDIETSASALTAALKGFNIEATNAIRIVDSLNEVDNNYSITTQQLAESLMRSAGTAAVYGSTLENVIGYTTAIGEVTRESGSVIGNSLKSIFSRISSVPAAVEGLQEIGISIRNSAGEMRSVDEILAELAGKWNTLSKAQQQNLGVNIAGRYQLSRFLTLMENFDQAMAASESAANSHGSALRENEAYLDSYEAKINKVKNAWTEAALSMQESFIGDAILGVTYVGTDAIKLLSRLIDEVGLLPVIFGTASTALMLFNTNLRTTAMTNGEIFLKFLRGLPSGFKTLESSVAGATLKMKIFDAVAKTTTTTMSVLGKGIAALGRFLIGSFLPVAGFMALGSAISFVTEKIVENRQERERLEKENQTSIDSMTNERDRINELVNEYERLSNIDRNVEQEERYTQLQNELAQLLPTVKVGEDEKGNAIIATTSAVRDNIAALERQLEVERELKRLEAEQTISENRDEIQERIKELDELREKYNRLSETYALTLERGNLQDQGIARANLEDARQELQDFQEEHVELINEVTLAYEELARQVEGVGQSEATWIGQIALEANLTESEVIELANAVITLKDELGSGFNLGSISNLEQFNVVQDVTERVKNGGTAWDDYRQDLINVGMEAENINNILGNLKYTEEELQAIATQMNVTNQNAVPIFNDMLEVVGFTDQAMSDLDDTIEETTESVDELLQSYNDAISNIRSLNGVINDLNEGHGLSADSIALLMEKYSQFLPYLDDETALRQAIQKEIEKEEQVAINALSNKLLAEEKYLNEVLSGNNEFYNWLFDTYGVDLKNFKNLAQAKAQVENQLINEMSRKWSRFYNAQTRSLTDMGRAFRNMDVSKMGIMEREMYEITRAQMSNEIYRFEREMANVQSRFNAIVSDQISVSFGGIGLSRPSGGGRSSGGRSSGRRSSGGRSSRDDAARKAEEAQRRVLELIQKQIEAIKHRSDSLNDNIALEEYYLQRYEKTDRQYRQRQRNIANLKKQQADYHKQIINYIEKELKNNKKLNSEQRVELQKTLVQTRETYYSILSDIDNITKRIKESYEEIANQVIDTFKEVYQRQKEIALDTIDNELRALQDAHRKKIDMLDEELAAYERIIKAKIDSIDKTADEEDYAERLAEMQKERLEIQRQIDILSLDDSMEARRRVRELEEQLREQEKAIADFQRDRERELRKRALEEQLEDKRQQIEEERELENSRFEQQQKQLEIDRKNIEQHYEDLLNNERKFAQMREQILKGNVNSISKTLQSFSKDINDNMEIIGRSISHNLIDKIKETRNLLSGIKFSFSSYVTGTPNSKHISSFDTGGFTGNFKGGRLAVVHEKELILNKHDTSNILKTVGIVRKLASVIPKLTPPSPANRTENNQNVFNIDVTMYGVNDTEGFYRELNEGLQSLGVQFKG